MFPRIQDSELHISTKKKWGKKLFARGKPTQDMGDNVFSCFLQTSCPHLREVTSLLQGSLPLDEEGETTEMTF